MAIARAIVTEPVVLLADEPTGNLDSQRSREIMELLWRLNAEQGITVLMVTHEPDMAEYARRMVRFVDGVVDSDTLNPHPVGLRGMQAPVVAARQPGEPRDAVQHHLAGVALHPAQPDALVPHHPGHRDRGERGDHHGDAGQRRHLGCADANLQPGHQPAASAARPAHGAGWRHRRAVIQDTDADAIAQQIGGILAWRRRRAGATVVAGGRNWTTSVIGSTNDWLQTGNWTVQAGGRRSPRTARRAAVCLIGETIRRELLAAATRWASNFA